MEAIHLPERQSRFRDFETEQREHVDRVFALTTYDIPADISPADLILFSLHIFATPDREVDLAKLRKALEACGEHGIHHIEGFMADSWPFIHGAKFMDTIDSLGRNQLIGFRDDGVLSLTADGQAASQLIFDRLHPHQQVTSDPPSVDSNT